MAKRKGKFSIDPKKKSVKKKAMDSLKEQGFKEGEDVHGGFIKIGVFDKPEDPCDRD